MSHEPEKICNQRKPPQFKNGRRQNLWSNCRLRFFCFSSNLRQHRTITSAAFSGSFTPEIRYFFLKYTKHSCEKLPFSTAKSPAECSCRMMRYCPNQLWSAIALAICGNNCYTMIGLFFGCSFSGDFCSSSPGFGAFLRCFSLAR